MKTLGLIGGTSWHSTIEYYRYLNQIVGERLSPQVNPPLLMYSLNVELMRRGDWEEINHSYTEIALNLQRAGAEAILICANTPHKVYPHVAPKLDIPILHIADAIGQKAQALGLQRPALLGTINTMEEDFIKAPLAEKYDMQVMVPKADARKQMHAYIADELTQGIFQDATRKYMVQEMEQLQTAGADGMILACTEFPILLKAENFDLPLLNTTYLHAQMAVDFILGSSEN